MAELQQCARCFRTAALFRIARWHTGMHIVEMLCHKCIARWIVEGYNVKLYGYNELAPWNEIDALNAEINRLQIESNGRQDENKRLKEAYSIVQDDLQRYKLDNQQLDAARNKAHTAQNDVEIRLSRCASELADTRDDLYNARESIETLKAEQARLDSAIASVLIEIKNKDDLITDLRVDLDRAQRRADNLAAENGKQADLLRAASTSELLRLASNLQAQCDEKDAEIERLQKGGHDLINRLDTLTAEYEKMTEDRNAWKDAAAGQGLITKHGGEISYSPGVATFEAILDNGMVISGELANYDMRRESRGPWNITIKGRVTGGSISRAGTQDLDREESAAEGSNGKRETAGNHRGDTPDPH